ncbi:hypothetical protein TNCV_2249411 [Trichonephila clavipes]|nr:hypothetical protein TNCV_2249411 [Trichonephila clavipes]
MSPSIVHCQFFELFGARWSTASKLSSLWNCSASTSSYCAIGKSTFLKADNSLPFKLRKQTYLRRYISQFSPEPQDAEASRSGFVLCLKLVKLVMENQEVFDLLRQIKLEVNSDVDQELPDSHNQKLTIDELIEIHEQEQTIEELGSL